MLFITNRFPEQSIRTRLGRNFSFDLDNNAASNSVFFYESGSNEKHTEIGNIEFLSQLKSCKYCQVLIYIHGFSNLPKGVLEAAEELQTLCNKKKKNEILVIPVIWPCDNDLGIVKDYWDDQKAADQSAFSFSRVLEKFLAWRSTEKFNPESDPCLKRINVLAHSMGNRVLRETLFAWHKYDLPKGLPMMFRNTFLVSADVVTEAFHSGEPGEINLPCFP